MTMIVIALLLAAARSVHSFTTPVTFVMRQSVGSVVTRMARDSNFDLGGNTWKPDSEKMGSTDTGDYFPEGYDKEEVAFSDGMMGSQGGKGSRGGPALPGMENLGADAIMMGGIEEQTEIPDGMEFLPSRVPDGRLTMKVAANSKGAVLGIDVKPVCMTFEDFYASFSPDSHPSFSVLPVTGRMDRRGGETSKFVVACVPKGRAGELKGTLVINLPEDNSKICYEITANSF